MTSHIGCGKVQDPYCLRCMPQVHGATRGALAHVRSVFEVELNSATDNPLLFPPDPAASGGPSLDSLSPEAYRAWIHAEPGRIDQCARSVIGGGNFHGEPLAIAMDYLKIAMAEVANICERRVAHLVDSNMSAGLPAFLIEDGGINSGYMIPQYTAAALVSENKVLAHPASVDSIPTCAGSEDHVSMGTIAARKAAELLENVQDVIAIELLAGYQALEFRKPLVPGHRLQRVLEIIGDVDNGGIARFTEDRVIYPEFRRMRALMASPRLRQCLLTDVS